MSLSFILYVSLLHLFYLSHVPQTCYCLIFAFCLKTNEPLATFLVFIYVSMLVSFTFCFPLKTCADLTCPIKISVVHLLLLLMMLLLILLMLLLLLITSDRSDDENLFASTLIKVAQQGRSQKRPKAISTPTLPENRHSF
jgi:hypothetical protein